MTADSILVLFILATAIVLFVSEKLRADVVALLVLLALIASGLLTIEEAFQGFASPAVVTVWAVFIISAGLQATGVADLFAAQLLRLAGASETRLLFLLMVGAGLMSAFMNNIGAVAILMPTVISVGRKMDISPAKLLMPLAFAALLGGNMTLIGTPPNILAAEIMQERGLEPFGFFDFTPTGLLVLGAGMAYMMLIGRRLLPDRIPPGGLAQEYRMDDYLAEVRVGPGSVMIGKEVRETDLGARFNLNVVLVFPRGEGEAVSTLSQRPLAPDDILLLEGKPQDILSAGAAYDLQPIAEPGTAGWAAPEAYHLAEVTMGPKAKMQKQTLREIDFRERYGLSVLAVRHNSVDYAERLGALPIRFGDSLLVQGPPERFQILAREGDWLVLETPDFEQRRTSRIPLAIAVLLGVIVSAALGLFHVSALMLAGALLMVIGGALSMDEAYQAIDWKAVFLIAAMLPLGTAMEKTGTAQLLADQLVALTGGLGAVAVLCALFVMTALLTEVISNAAAAVLVVPIAIDVGLGLGLNPQPFVMSAVIAASTSFLMPIGHQVNIIIFGAGGYKFFDFTRVGVGLNLLLLAVTAVFVPLIWPF
jgi:di/tricarboxylate transporter